MKISFPNLPLLIADDPSILALTCKLIGGFSLIGLGVLHPDTLIGFLLILAGSLVFTEL